MNKDIYNERLNLGRQIFNKVLSAIDKDLKNTVFSYIPLMLRISAKIAEASIYGTVKSKRS